MIEPYTFTHKINSEALRLFSEWLFDAARQFEIAATMAEDSEARSETLHRRRQALSTALDVMANYIINGYGHDSVIAMTAAMTGLDHEALEVSYPKAIRMVRRNRNKKISKMAAAGIPDEQIATAVDLKPQTVAKIRRKMKKAA